MNNSIEVNNLDPQLLSYRYVRIPDRLIEAIYKSADYDVITYKHIDKKIGLVALYEYNNHIYGSWSIANPLDTFNKSTALKVSEDRVIELISENQNREYHDCDWDRFPKLNYEGIVNTELLKLFKSQLFDLARDYYLSK